EFDVVLPVFPGNVVNVVPVGIHTMPRVAGAGAQLRERTHVNAWQAEIVSLAAGHQSDARRIKVPVLRVEPFCEAVPPDAHFVERRGTQNGDERDGNELHASRGERVVGGKSSAADQSQRETLFTVAQEIAPGKSVVLIELVVDLDDAAIDVV